MLKSSRRKQSKPLKVLHGEGEANNNEVKEDSEMPELTDRDVMRADAHMEEDDDSSNDMPIITCSMCPDTFATMEHLSKHMNDAHPEKVQQIYGKDLSNSYPTEYHRLASEIAHPYSNLQNGNEDVTGSPGSDEMLPAEFDPKDSRFNGEIKRPNSTKIFHQDAYCQLCDKEFCNKYFLKTHRANKHGIFDSSPPPPSFPVGALPTSMMTSMSMSMPPSMMTSMPPEAITPPSFRLDLPIESKTPSEKSVSEGSNSGSHNTSSHNNSCHNNGSHNNQLGTEILPKDITISKEIKPVEMTLAEKKEKDMSKEMEDFCEHCQKHFCNKYYLKKHKQDVHGIVPEPSVISNKRGRPPTESQASSTNTITSSPMFMPQNIPGLPNMPNMSNMPGVMVLNPFLPPVALIPQTILQQQQQQQQLQLPPIFSSPALLPNVSESSIQSSTSPIPESMRGLSGLTQEAFCDICRKEFCNKYFLKIHKANKHGVFCDDININNMRKNLFGPFFGMDSGLCSPGEIKRDIKQEPMAVTELPGFNGTGSGAPDSYVTFCSTCNKEFYSKYAYKIHRMNVHGMLGEEMTSAENGGLDRAERVERLDRFDRQERVDKIEKVNRKERHDRMDRIERFDRMDRPDVRMDLFERAERMDRLERADRIERADRLERANRLERLAADRPERMDIVERTVAKDLKFEDFTMDYDQKSVVSDDGKPSGKNSSTMFSSMIAAKLADRVICDICNKELCNKYFLKAHKLKIHGVETPLDPPPPGDSKSPSVSSEPQNLSMLKIGDQPQDEPENLSITAKKSPSPRIFQQSMDLTPSPVIEKPHNGELVKLGIDPEAYCDICKKEFCSKYFLRTHKLNIHGIRSDSTPVKDMPPMPLPGKHSLSSHLPLNLSSPLSTSINLPPTNFFPSSMSSPLMNPSSMSSPMMNPSSMSSPLMNHSSMSLMNPSSMSLMNPSLMNPTTALLTAGLSSASLQSSLLHELSLKLDKSNKIKSPFEKSSWRWKESSNSQRVTCELCNKELCNKYFLRTHKVNKHGIPLSEQSNCSPTPSDMDGASNNSNQTDCSDRGLSSPHPSKSDLKSDRGHALNLTVDKTISAPGNALNLKLPKFDERSLGGPYYSGSTDICHFCNKSFKNAQWLKLHLMKDHSDLCGMLETKSPVYPSNGLTNMETKMCQVCNMMFPNEISMHLHMIQEHNAQINLKTEIKDEEVQPSPPTPKLSPSFAFGLRHRTPVSNKQRLYNCARCDYKTKWLSNLQTHEETRHNLQQRQYSIYTCKKCSKAFLSEKSLMQHAVSSHDVDYDHFDKDAFIKCEPKTYKCMWCSERFNSKLLINRHIRDYHIRGRKNFKISKKLTQVKTVCRFCSFSTRYMKQLKSHMIRFHSGRTDSSNNATNDVIRSSGKDNSLLSAVVDSNNTGNFQMQKFQVNNSECDETLVPAVVQLPVKHTIIEPLTILVTLTPLEQ